MRGGKRGHELQFVTIPASGSIRVEHLRENSTVKRKELKVGMKYWVWMSNSLLNSAGRYSYWGDMELRTKNSRATASMNPQQKKWDIQRR
jgi:hypothetical protein